MSQKISNLLAKAGIILFCLLAAAASTTSATYITPASRAHSHSQLPAGIQAHKITRNPITKKLDSTDRLMSIAAAGASIQFTCQSNTNPNPFLCYGPLQLRQAYGLNALNLAQKIDGRKSNIVIIDAYGDDYVANNLKAFDLAWGLPDPQLTVLKPFGVDGPTSGSS